MAFVEGRPAPTIGNDIMKFDPKIHHRRSIRLQGYDYSQSGAYYVTIVTHGRECLFGEVVNGAMQLNEYGKIVEFTWNDLVNHVNGIELDVFVVMPNHVHGIVVIVGAGSEPAPTPNKPLSEIVRQFKTFSARRINDLRNTRGIPVWQRNYYEHIIRDEKSYQRISEYIINNPVQWQQDELYNMVIS